MESSTAKGTPSLRILLAEDNATNQMALRLMLERDGHTVTTADNGVQAVELLRRQPFDVVLMDIQMPQLDGVAATRRIREDTSGDFDPTLPIVALTAYAMPGDREKFLAAGMTAYLAKPVRLDDLRDMLLRGWQAA